MRWPWRRTAEQDRPAPVGFDASIDIDRAEAVDAVRARVAALPGAGWISVEAHPAGRSGVRLFAAGSGLPAMGAIWRALQRQVEQAVAAALAEAAPGGWAEPAPVQAGFAEALSHFDALEQLEALARQARASTAAPRPPPPPEPAARIRPPAPPPVRMPDPPPRTRVTEPRADDGGSDDVSRLAGLLALVLPNDGREPAAAAIRRFGSYAAVLAAPEVELRLVPGLGQHTIAAIKLIHVAAVRHARAGLTGRPVLDDRDRLRDYLAAALARERIEQFRILFLDARGMLQADEVQARGTVNHTPVYPREVVRRAIALGATSIVLVHNHPSGDPTPSREDVEMTRQVREAAEVMQIGLRDHLIIGNGRWLSFREEGLLR